MWDGMNAAADPIVAVRLGAKRAPISSSLPPPPQSLSSQGDLVHIYNVQDVYISEAGPSPSLSIIYALSTLLGNPPGCTQHRRCC
jgi:hypothetical protein